MVLTLALLWWPQTEGSNFAVSNLALIHYRLWTTNGPLIEITHKNSGCGRIVLHSTCNVEWRFYLPKLDLTPYIIMVSHGIHNHMPPPPESTPLEVISQLQEVLRASNRPPQTLRKWSSTGYRPITNLIAEAWLRSNELQAFLASRGATTLSDLHPSLINHTRLSRLIQQNNLLHYPQGQARLGAAFEYETKHKGREDAVSLLVIYNRLWTINGSLVHPRLWEWANLPSYYYLSS